MPPANPRGERHSPAGHSDGRVRRNLTPGSDPGPPPPSKLGDTAFAVAHVLALVAVFVYGLVALIGGNIPRFALVGGGLVVYYFLVLQKPVKNEIARRREGRPKR